MSHECEHRAGREEPAIKSLPERIEHDKNQCVIQHINWLCTEQGLREFEAVFGKLRSTHRVAQFPSDGLRAVGESFTLPNLVISGADGSPEIAEHDKSGTIPTKVAGDASTLRRPDGSVEVRDHAGRLTLATDSQGTMTIYRYDREGDSIPSEYTVRSRNSSLEEVYYGSGIFRSYQFTDKNGHREILQKEEDGSWTLLRGDRKDSFSAGSNVHFSRDGSHRIIAQDGPSFESRADGTTILRDKRDHVGETSTADGLVTTFSRDVTGMVQAIEIKNGLGEIVEKSWLESDGWHTTLKGPSGETAAIAIIDINDGDGSYVIKLDSGVSVRRNFDGTEEWKELSGAKIDTPTDKLLKLFEVEQLPMSVEGQRQLRSDLAIIEKLSGEECKKVCESLRKLGEEDTTSTTKLTASQRSELIISLAHQIACPESISQGVKQTCIIASAEVMIASQQPEIYADMVARLATTGEYTSKLGTTVKAQVDQSGHLMGSSDRNMMRSLTSELFQNAAANLCMREGEHYVSFPPGSPMLLDKSGKLPFGVTAANDAGERIITDGGNMRGSFGFTVVDQERILDELMPSPDLYEITEPIETASDLEKAFEINGGLPLLVSFNTASAKFSGMSGDTSGSNHAVLVTNIVKKQDGTVLVYYDNTTGGDDHNYPEGTGVPIEEFMASLLEQGVVVCKAK